ncbi:MAG TPA: hypothetical protein VFG68_17140 [Fimbriiglobus sp.]|nr:hypothetical protein [Fimbriiglobus sp.]
MRSTTTRRLLTAVPALALAAGSVYLAATAFAGPEAAPTPLPENATAAAPAPEGLSPVASTSDWQETVDGSIIIRRPRR